MRIGKIARSTGDCRLFHPPREWNYRNHVQFHLTRAGRLGYVDAASRSVLPITECHLPEPPLDAICGPA